MMKPIARTLLGLCVSVSVAKGDGAKPNYEQDVAPILKQHCVNCHGDDKQRGGLNLAGYGKIMEGGSSGVVVKAGDADGSRLYSLTAHKEEPKMPPNAARIPDPQLEILKKWIEQGHREKSDSKVSMVAKPKVDLSLKTSARGKPEGPPPMPKPGALALEPTVRGSRANAITALATSPWAPLAAIAGPRQILLYHTDTAELLGTIPFEHGQIYSLKFSRNAKMLLAAGGRGGQSGKAVLYEVETGKKITEVGIETDVILSADLSPDQSQIAVGSPSKLIRCYATADGSVIREIKKHTDWVTAVEFSPDGVLLATGDRNGGVFVWEAETGREFHTLRGHTAMITDLSWRADANMLATGSEDSTVRLWEMENGRQIKSFGAHGGGVQSVRFAADGTIASTGRDRVVKHWDGNGTLKKQFTGLKDIGLRVAVTHDNARVIAGDWTGQVSAWTAADGKAAASFDANPAGVAERIKQAEAVITAAEQVVVIAAEQEKTAIQNLEKASLAAAAAQKAVNDIKAAVNADAATVNAAMKTHEAATLAVGTVERIAVARKLWSDSLATAAKAMGDAAAKEPKNNELQAVLTEANAAAKKAAGETATATATVAEKVAEAAKAKQALDAVKATQAGKSAAVAEAEKKATAATQAVTAVNAAKAQATAKRAEAEKAVVAAKEALAKLKAVKKDTAKP